VVIINNTILHNSFALLGQYRVLVPWGVGGVWEFHEGNIENGNPHSLTRAFYYCNSCEWSTNNIIKNCMGCKF
jgi:hypothetical protein